MALAYLCLETWSHPLCCSSKEKIVSWEQNSMWRESDVLDLVVLSDISWNARIFPGQESCLRGGAADYPSSYPDMYSVILLPKILFPYVGASIPDLTKVLVNQYSFFSSLRHSAQEGVPGMRHFSRCPEHTLTLRFSKTQETWQHHFGGRKLHSHSAL